MTAATYPASGPTISAEGILYGATPVRGLGEIAAYTDEGTALYRYVGEEDFISEYRERGGELRKVTVLGGHKLFIADFKINGVAPEDTISLYLRDGKLHRDKDLPAVEISASGCGWWFKEGKKHRDLDASGASLPAVISDESWEYWYQGMLHRHDGVAKVSPWGDKVWAWRGKQYQRHDLWLAAKRSDPLPDTIFGT